MNMDARIVAAEGIYNATSSGVLFPWETLDDKSREHMGIMADGALTALKMSGYAITKLPDPSDQLWDEGDEALFASTSGTPVRVTWSKQVVYDTCWLHPSEARSDAAALLAAANVAEAES